MSKIRAVAEGVDMLAIKPHPYSATSQKLRKLSNEISNARITQSNIYRILSDVKLKHVSLSSSVIDEAALFGVKTTRLIVPDRDCSSLIPEKNVAMVQVAACSCCCS
jgi:hypothetical protein